jgi:type 2 lantibiotic biosynthesis protein LanM
MLLPHEKTLELTSIVAQASTLSERLNSSFIPKLVSKDEIQISERLEQWCHVVAEGKLGKFQRRLAWSGLDIDTIRPLLASNPFNEKQPDEQQPLPVWANTLGQVIQTARTLSSKDWCYPYLYLDSENPVPFESVYVPCLQVAHEKLITLAGEHLKLLTDTAIAALERKLLQQLGNLCSQTLMEEFSAFRSSGDALRDFFLLSIDNSKSQEKYHAFIQKLFQDGLLSLFQEYTVLGRLVATAIDFWVEATAEFLNRLATDWSEIEQCFGGDIALKQVMDIKAGLSDPHNRGRSVMTLTFDTGMRLVYKPKNLSLDVAFYQFLKWLNNHATPLTFKVLQILNHSSYGWMEYIEALPCEGEEAVQRFYQRSGMLLCLIHALEGTDCHYENLIANGEQPVLVDIETLLHHRNKSIETEKNDAQVLVEKQLEKSVLRTMILPQWGMSNNDQLTIDLSGLGGAEEQKVLVARLKNINTDVMSVSHETVVLKEANILTLNGIAICPNDYLEELVTGFEQMYRLLFSSQALLLAPTSPLMTFAQQKVRYVFRSTRIYHSIQQSSYQPSLLRSGIDRSIALDVLSRAFVATEEKPVFCPMLAAELQAMEQLDIPFFTANSSSDSLELPTGLVIPELFEKPSFDQMLLRIQSLSEADLNQQIEIIRGSFYSRFFKEPSPISCKVVGKALPKEVREVRKVKEANLPFASDLLIQQAIKIATELQQQATHGNDGSISWISPTYRPNTQGFQLQSLGSNLYDGSSGVALFLAALAKITGDLQWHDLALRTLQPINKIIEDSHFDNVTKITRLLGISGATGLASIAYALTEISKLLQEPELLKNALFVASLITKDLIAADQTFDIMGGVAGVILGLLALPAPTFVELAVSCGEHLLKHQTSIDGRPKAWKNKMGKQLTGFSQGAAGIAYALLRLFDVTQDSRFLDAAREAIAYERSIFSPEAENWPDLRFEGLDVEASYQISWAHGASGIGLARLGGLSVLDTPEIRQEIAIALKTTQKFAVWGVDHLCWGNLGRIETLLVAAQTLKQPELLGFVNQATSQIIAQAEAQGKFNLFADSRHSVYNPGFFHGTSGIGYELLRIAYPNVLPSVLLWQV